MKYQNQIYYLITIKYTTYFQIILIKINSFWKVLSKQS